MTTTQLHPVKFDREIKVNTPVATSVMLGCRSHSGVVRRVTDEWIYVYGDGLELGVKLSEIVWVGDRGY